MSARISRREAARLRGSAIRKFFNLPEPAGNPAPRRGQLAQRTDAPGDGRRKPVKVERNPNFFHGSQARTIVIGRSTDKAALSIGALNEFDVVAAVLRERPETERIVRQGRLLFEAGR